MGNVQRYLRFVDGGGRDWYGAGGVGGVGVGIGGCGGVLLLMKMLVVVLSRAVLLSL